ncbi:MAG: phosphohistidine phosphatase SixA [Cyanobacteria bacterium P01_A01_bin.114]
MASSIQTKRLQTQELQTQGPAEIVTEVYLIRHGIAAERGSYADDAQRPLIEKGIRKTQRVAERLKELGISFDVMLTSPLVRAAQTTQILQQAGLSHRVDTFTPLAPGGSLSQWLTWLETWQRGSGGQRIALIGHEPDLSEWAQRLVVGSIDHRWALKKAGVAGLRVPSADNAIAHSELFLWVPPRFLL